MRLPNLVHAAGSALLLALLSGCAPSDASTPPEPTATFVAPYATDEEALAAAEEAYADYSRVSTQILNDGGEQADRLSAVATGEFLDESLESFAEARTKGLRGLGASSFVETTLQRYSPVGSPKEIVVVYLCEDVSQLDLLDKSGTSIVPKDRNDTIMLQVTFDFVSSKGSLSVSGVERWREEPC